jgi:hypothetical protein
MVRFIRFVAWLTARRVRAGWPLMLVSAFGVLLAVTLVSVAAIHSSTLAEAGLSRALYEAPSRNLLNLQTIVQDRPMGRADYERVRSVVDDALQARAGWLASDTSRMGRSQILTYVDDIADVPTETSRQTYVYFHEGFQEHARLVSGRWPQPTAASDDGFLTLEVVIGAEAAASLGWPDEMTVYLVPFGTAPAEKITATVVGTVEPADPEDAYWFGSLSRFRLVEGDGEPIVPMYSGQELFFGGLGEQYPMLLGSYWWYVTLDVESLTAATASLARDSLEAMESDVNRSYPRSMFLTSLNGVISDYRRDLALVEVPLFMFTFLVVGVVLYYLVIISMMLARHRGAEAAMIRSRGATVFQVGALLGFGEGLIIAVPAVLIGPFLGWALASLLPAGSSALEAASAGLSLSVFALAGMAGLICVAVFLATGTGTASRDIVQFLRDRGRGPEQPALFRYAIDMLVLATVGLVWWQIQSRGGFLTQGFLGDGLESAPTLLVWPALVLLAVGLILLRALPFLLRLLARLADPIAPLWLAHALKRMARDHLAYGTLAVLVMIATALGVFGAMFGATLAASHADQARYSVGAELVVPPLRVAFGRAIKEPAKEVGAIPGVAEISPVFRDTVATAGGSLGGANYSLLAVETATLPLMTWFRDDFADQNLNDLLRTLRQPSPMEHGVSIPEGTQAMGIWVQAERPYPGYNFYLRLRDASGQYASVSLGQTATPSWVYLEGPMPEEAYLQPPFTLVSIYVSGSPRPGYGIGSVALDEITAVVRGEQQVIEGFETPGPWTLLPYMGVAQDMLDYREDAAHSGSGGALFSWTEPIDGSERGLLVSPVPMPMPAIGNSHFSVGQEFVVRVLGQPVSLRVREVADYFPTLYPDVRPFLVVNSEHLERYLDMLPMSRPPAANEFWVGLEPDADRERIKEELRELLPYYAPIKDREERAELAKTNPLGGGAWPGLALLSAAALGGIVVLGFGLYIVLAVQRARVELGVLRALGLLRWRVGLVLALEGVMVAVIGIGVGSVAGAWIAQWTLGYLDVTSGGRQVVPPMKLTLDGMLAVTTYAQVTLAAVLATLLSLVLAGRLRLHEVLRLEE